MTNEHPCLNIEIRPDAQTIALAGEADLLGAAKIEEALRKACMGEWGTVVVDLSKLTFIDSSGLHALMAGHQSCRARGQEMRIIPGPENVQRLFELTGMNDSFLFYDAEPSSKAPQV